MRRILVLYYSSYGHIEQMAEAQAEGAARIAGTEATVKRVQELVPAETARAAGFKLDQRAPLATVDELETYDAIIFGTPTRFGNMAAPLKYFLDGTAALWHNGTLAGKPACVFTSTASMHGGQETTITSFHTTLLHHGMVIVGLPYTEPALDRTRGGGTPYGASHVAGQDANPTLVEEERILARALGRRLALTAKALAGAARC